MILHVFARRRRPLQVDGGRQRRAVAGILASQPRPGVVLSPATAAAQATGHVATGSLALQQSGPGVVANSVHRV